MSNRILERNNATRYRSDEKEHENLRRLINLLDGFPLAMEVVLANLAKQTPQEILDALQAGDVKIDPHSGSQEKTASILRCIDYSHSNLSPEAQQLLLCLAPFTSVIWQTRLDRYTNHLKQQPILTDLPFDQWSEVLREAQNWGLLSPHEVPGYLYMQPTLAYFLRHRLNETGQSEVRRAIEAAFREHYDEVGGMLSQLLESKEPRERQVGQLLISLEYENLVTALNLALEAQVSILEPYRPLSNYLDITQDQRRGLELGQVVLRRLEVYPPEKLTGALGVEFVGVIDDIAIRQLLLKRYKEAEGSYQRALSLLLGNKGYDASTIKKLSGSINHQLGAVAQEQRQWQQAKQYYQQALQIEIECDDRHSQALTYHNLGVVTEEQRQWQQAEQYYQQTLQIYIEFQDRYSQAGTYHQLGSVTQGQEQWQQAEQYCQQALQIYIEYDDRSGQARLYHQLGTIAQDQRQWQQASGYLLRALHIFVEYKDNYGAGITLRNLARLWKASDDVSVRARIAKAFEMSVEETEKMLLERLGEREKGQTGGEEEKG